MGWLLSTCVLASSGCNTATTDAPAERAAVDADIGLAEAIAIARQAVPQGVPVEAELEVDPEEDEVTYEVVLRDGERLVEVEIDPATGKVLEIEDEEDEDEDDEDEDEDDEDG